MEFAIGTLVGVLAIVVAYLTYRSQLGQSFKRIHYSSFMTDFIMPQDDETRQPMTVRYVGTDLIYPILCGTKIENTGRSPILVSDFNGPIVIQHKGTMIFRCGRMILNRPNIIDADSPESLKLDTPKNEIHIGPTLLNPRDSITLVYVVDALPNELSIEVIGRVAGIEKIVRLPKKSERASFTLNGQDLPIASTQKSQELPLAGLSICIVVLPVLFDPDNMFSNRVDVFVRGTIIKNAHIVSIVISNDGATSVERSDNNIIILKLPQSRIIRLVSAQAEQRSPGRPSPLITDAEADLHLIPASHQITVNPPRLTPNETLRIKLLVSGNCDDLIAESHGTTSYNAQLVQFDVHDILEQNFAKAGPRLLLSNRRAYALWHSLTEDHPWLRKAFSKDKA
jgi:hypothetical protein